MRLEPSLRPTLFGLESPIGKKAEKRQSEMKGVHAQARREGKNSCDRNVFVLPPTRAMEMTRGRL